MKQSSSQAMTRGKKTKGSTIHVHVPSNSKLNSRTKRASAANSTLKLKKVCSGNVPKHKIVGPSASVSKLRRTSSRDRGKRSTKVSPQRVESNTNQGKRRTRSPTRRSSALKPDLLKRWTPSTPLATIASGANFKSTAVKNQMPEEVRDYLATRKYSVVCFLDEGATAKVYEVLSPEGERMAAKVLPRAIGIGTEELSLLTMLKHPFISPVKAIFATTDYSIILAELASEGDLITYIERLDKPNTPQARVWFGQITDAVAYLHDQGIAHRDIKADNVLLCRAFATCENRSVDQVVAKLTDFGAATHSIDPVMHQVNLCKTSRGGTFEYKAPECLGPGAPFDPFIADCFSLGVLLYTLVTHEFPFGGGGTDDYRTEAGTAAIKTKIVEKKWATNEEIQADFTLYSLLRQLLNPEPLERITARQVMAASWVAKAPSKTTTIAPK